MTELEVAMDIRVAARHFEPFRYHFSDEVYVVDYLQVVFSPDVNGVLAVRTFTGGGRRVLKDNVRLHKVYSKWLSLWEWGAVPSDLRGLIEAAAVQLAVKVRFA